MPKRRKNTRAQRPRTIQMRRPRSKAKRGSAKKSAAHGRKSAARKKANHKSWPKRRKTPRKWHHPDRLEVALRYIREGESLKRAAERAFVSKSELRAYLRENRLARWHGRKWKITDRRAREIVIISTLGELSIKVRGFDKASLAMRHRAAVQQFRDSNDVTLLTPFEGQTVTDTAKQKHVLETRPNVLLRLANAGSDADMKIYRLID